MGTHVLSLQRTGLQHVCITMPLLLRSNFLNRSVIMPALKSVGRQFSDFTVQCKAASYAEPCTPSRFFQFVSLPSVESISALSSPSQSYSFAKLGSFQINIQGAMGLSCPVHTPIESFRKFAVVRKRHQRDCQQTGTPVQSLLSLPRRRPPRNLVPRNRFWKQKVG